MPAFSSLKEFVAYLASVEHVPRPDGEEWSALIARISVPGRVAVIDEETFWYFLDVLPPKCQRGNLFAFAEGAEELRLFWRSGEEYLCRQLTWDETKEFCRLAGTSFPYWY
jgi:hypothetical protein